jgi:hypothetical protein
LENRKSSPKVDTSWEKVGIARAEVEAREWNSGSVRQGFETDPVDRQLLSQEEMWLGVRDDFRNWLIRAA